MGKRRKSAKRQTAKKGTSVAKSFKCPFCSHEDACEVKLDRKTETGRIACRVCGEDFQCRISVLSDPVDVFCEWTDALEAARGGGGGGGGAWGSSRMGTVRSPDHSPTRHRVKPLSPREADFESTASSCHWCRHPQPLRVCLRCSLCRDVLFCMRCYGARMCRPSARDAEVADALARRASWICPPCRGYCNCSGQGPKAHLFKLTGNRASGQMNSFCKSLDLTVNEILEQTEFSPLSVAYTLKKIKWPGRAKGRHPWPTAEQRVTTAALPSSRSPPRAGPTSVPEGGEGDPAPPQSRPPFD